MWRARAEQVHQTLTAFTAPQLRAALKKIFDADRALRDARPDDRVVMENFIFSL
jgi:DNA polymerase-3 subunit delta